MKKLLIPLALSVILTGCHDNTKPVTAEDLMHHRFELTDVNNNKLDSEKKPFIEFGENMTINARMCNTFFGKFALKENTISSSDLASTRMLCADQQLNQLDQQLGDMLANGAKVQLNDQTLTLTQGDKSLTFTLRDLVN